MTLRLAPAAAALGLCACSTAPLGAPLDAPLSSSFGVAAATLGRQAAAAAPSAGGPAASSGARGAEAIRRYEAGEVRPLEPQGASGGGVQAPGAPPLLAPLP
ncbi:hypothetical protein [Phenylobacterium sp.]|uniref:hypothetical protein n=1 Tax=Phenylobacterium sp. TaxID=1871053 RepID=UPI002C4206D3|nr:hypothetical protein [Phenylobacterium sp.]HVI31059.1 hypothetical protein [Phenylobacterium sp.]